MNILHVLLSRLSLPPAKYGGTERVVWSLAQAQLSLGHQVRFLWKKAKNLPANTIIYNPNLPISEQVGQWPDIVHFHWPYEGELNKPFVCTEHGNANVPRQYPINTIFLSRKHAENHGADFFVYNGLDWREYGEPNLNQPKRYHHFLGKAKAPAKNLRGAIDIANRARLRLDVLGGSRLNVTRNPYIYLDTNVRFHGMVGGQKKLDLIKGSRGLIAPSRWHEPFGLAITESLYLGAPVFATPYGSLPEIIDQEDIGFLSDNYDELAEAAAAYKRFDRRRCHEVAVARFGMLPMAESYIRAYDMVIQKETLNKIAPRAEKSYIDLLPVNNVDIDTTG